MKLTYTLRELIVENTKSEVLYNKYVKPNPRKNKKGMDFDAFKQIVLADPTTRIPNDFDIERFSSDNLNELKVGKYSDWMLRLFLNPDLSRVGVDLKEYQRLFLEDLIKYNQLLNKFEKYKGSLVDSNKRDINNVLSFEELAALPIKVGDDTVRLELYRGQKAKKNNRTQFRENFKYPGSEIIFEGPNYTLVRISDTGELGSKAASFFGGYHNLDRGESSWCTAPVGSTYSHNYRQDGPLYVILANDSGGKVGEITGLPTERYQFHFPSNQFMDRGDKPINLVEMLNGKLSELKEPLKPEFAKGITFKGGERLEINYVDNRHYSPKDAAGTFVAVYGFNEVFEAAPKNITYMWISNLSKEDIALDVPPSITEFKDLKSLMLQNIVRSLPDNIGDLKNLEFLALTNNKNLESLPESLSNCEELTFINLKGSNPNIKLPGKLEQKLDKMGDGFYSTM